MVAERDLGEMAFNAADHPAGTAMIGRVHEEGQRNLEYHGDLGFIGGEWMTRRDPRHDRRHPEAAARNISRQEPDRLDQGWCEADLLLGLAEGTGNCVSIRRVDLP